MQFGKVQLASTAQMLAIVISPTWPILYITGEKTGPERAGDLSKITQLASNRARAELRFPYFCPRQTQSPFVEAPKGKEPLPFPYCWHRKLDK